MNTCTIRCQASQHDKCLCSCNGDNHGRQITFTPIPNIRECAHCPRTIHFESGKGWVHEGGMSYIMECPHCGWQGEQPAETITIETDICPNCRAIGDLQDNHVAMPGRAIWQK